MNIEEFKNSVNPRLDMIGIVNNSNLPATLKILGYTFLNSAKDAELIRLKDIFIKVMAYIEVKDTEGLKVYLTSLGIDPNVLKMIMRYTGGNDNPVKD